MADKVKKIMDLPDEYDKQAFEDLVVLCLKEHQKTMKNILERLDKLEHGGK